MSRSIATNYYIRKQQLNKAFLAGLRERKIGQKFSYTGKRQANSWLNLCKSTEYDYYRKSKALLQQTVHSFMAGHTGFINVIVLGPGDALKEKLVVNTLQEHHAVSLFFVDTSKEILNIAVKNMQGSEVLEELFLADVMDFEDIEDIGQYAKNQYNATNLFTVLGNTVGNYPQGKMLKTLRHAMAPEDKVLMDINVKLRENAEEEAVQIAEILTKFNNDAFRERNLACLSDTNITAADGTLEVEFSKDDAIPEIGVVKRYFRFTRSKVVTYQGEAIPFTKDERILMGYSNKYTFEHFEALLNAHGLRIVKQAQDDSGTIQQLLCALA